MSVTSLLQRLPLRKIAPYIPAVRQFMPTAPVGVILSEGRLRLVALREHPEQDWEIVQALDQPLPPGIMNGDDVLDIGGVTEFIGRIFEQLGLDPDNVVLGAPVRYSALRRAFLPNEQSLDVVKAKFGREELRELNFTMNTTSPQDLVRSVGIVPSSGQRTGMEVIGGIVIREPLRKLQKSVREAGLQIHAVDHPGLGIYNAFRRTVKAIQNKHLLLYLGPTRMLGVEVDLHGPTGVRSFDNAGGTELALQALQDKVSSGESAEDILFRRSDALALYSSLLEPWTSEIVRNTNTMVTRLLSGAEAATLTIKLCGDGAQVAGLPALIREATGAQCEILSPLVRIAHPRSGPTETPAAFGPFVPALGLALRHFTHGVER